MLSPASAGHCFVALEPVPAVSPAVSSSASSCSCPGSVTALVPCSREQQEQSHCHRAELAPAARGVFPRRVPGRCVSGLSLLPGDTAAGLIRADLPPPSLGKGRGSSKTAELLLSPPCPACSFWDGVLGCALPGSPRHPAISFLPRSSFYGPVKHHLALWILPWVLPCYSQSDY